LWTPTDVVFNKIWVDKQEGEEIKTYLNAFMKALYVIEVCENCTSVRVRKAGTTYMDVEVEDQA